MAKSALACRFSPRELELPPCRRKVFWRAISLKTLLVVRSDTSLADNFRLFQEMYCDGEGRD